MNLKAVQDISEHAGIAVEVFANSHGVQWEIFSNLLQRNLDQFIDLLLFIVFLGLQVEVVIAYLQDILYFEVYEERGEERLILGDIVYDFEVELKVVLKEEDAFVQSLSFLDSVLQVLDIQLIPKLFNSSQPLPLQIVNEISILIFLKHSNVLLFQFFIQPAHVLILIQVFKEFIELTDIEIHNSYESSGVVVIHEGQFEVFTFLLVEIQELIDLQQREGLFLETNLTIIILSEIATEYSREIIVVFKGNFEEFFYRELQLDAIEDHAERVPLDISFVLFGVVAEQNTIFIDFNEDLSYFEDSIFQLYFFGYGWFHGLSWNSFQSWTICFQGALVEMGDRSWNGQRLKGNDILSVKVDSLIQLKSLKIITSILQLRTVPQRRQPGTGNLLFIEQLNGLLQHGLNLIQLILRSFLLRLCWSMTTSMQILQFIARVKLDFIQLQLHFKVNLFVDPLPYQEFNHVIRQPFFDVEMHLVGVPGQSVDIFFVFREDGFVLLINSNEEDGGVYVVLYIRGEIIGYQFSQESYEKVLEEALDLQQRRCHFFTTPPQKYQIIVKKTNEKFINTIYDFRVINLKNFIEDIYGKGVLFGFDGIASEGVEIVDLGDDDGVVL